MKGDISMNGSFIKYTLGQNKKLMILLFTIGFVVFPLPLLLFRDYGQFISVNGYAYYLLVFLWIVSFILPYYNYHFVHSQKASDTYFGLPFTKARLFDHIFLLTVWEFILPFLVNILIAVGINGIIYQFYGIKMIFEVLGSAVVLGVSLLLFNLFILFKTNNIIDFIINTIAYHCLPFLAQMAFETFIYKGGKTLSYFRFKDILSLDYFYFNVSYMDHKLMILFGFVILDIIGYWYVKKIFTKRAVEDANQNTTSKAMYPFIILSYTLCLLILAVDEITFSTIFSIALIMLAYYILSFIAMRKIKFDNRSFILFITMIIVIFGLHNIKINTKMFGLEDRTFKDPEYVNFDLNYNYYDNDKNEYYFIDKAEGEYDDIYEAQYIQMINEIHDKLLDIDIDSNVRQYDNIIRIGLNYNFKFCNLKYDYDIDQDNFQKLKSIIELLYKNGYCLYVERYDNDYQRIMLSLDEAFDLLDIK